MSVGSYVIEIVFWVYGGSSSFGERGFFFVRIEIFRISELCYEGEIG